MPKENRTNFLVFLVFLLFFISLFHDVFFGQLSFFRRDLARFYYPMWKYGSESLRAGIIPLWNPTINFGQPFLANVQTCVFYPLTVLFYFGHYLWAFNFYILLHLALAGFFTTLWMRDCRLSWASSILAGLAYSLSGYMMSTINLTIALCSAVYFPLVLLCFRRALKRGGFLWQSLTGVSLLFQYLAGDPSILIGTLLCLSLFTVFFSVRESFRKKKIEVRAFGALGAASAVFLGLSAFQTLLLGEYLLQTARVNLAEGHRMIWSMQYNDLLGILVPFFSDLSMYVMDYWTRQSWLENYYAGAALIALALWGVWLGRKKEMVAFHAMLACLGIALSLGHFSLVYPVLTKCFPLLNFVRYPIRFFFLFSFAVACLGAFGLEEILSGKEQGLSAGRRRLLASGLFLLTGFVVAATIWFDPILIGLFKIAKHRFGDAIGDTYTIRDFFDCVYVAFSNIKRSALFLGLALWGVFAARSGRIHKKILAVYFVSLVVLDLTIANAIEIRIPARFIESKPSNVRVLLRDPDRAPFRIMASPKTARDQSGHRNEQGPIADWMSQKNRLISSTMMIYGIHDFLGYDSLYLKDTDRVQKALAKLKPKDPRHTIGSRGFRLDTRFMDMTNVKYVASPNLHMTGSLKLIHKAKETNLYLNRSFLPRAFFVRKYTVEADRERLLENILSPSFDPEETLYLEEAPPKTDPAVQSSGPAGTVDILDYGAQEIKMHAETPPGGRWLFLSDAYYPGWVAEVDGKRVKIYKANYAFRAIRLGSGSHEVRWRYDPTLFKIGSAITGLTIFGLAIYFVRRRLVPI